MYSATYFLLYLVLNIQRTRSILTAGCLERRKGNWVILWKRFKVTLAVLFFKGSSRGDLLFVQASSFITSFMPGKIIACLLRNDFLGRRKRKLEGNTRQSGSDAGQSDRRRKGYIPGSQHPWWWWSVWQYLSLKGIFSGRDLLSFHCKKLFIAAWLLKEAQIRHSPRTSWGGSGYIYQIRSLHPPSVFPPRTRTFL